MAFPDVPEFQPFKPCQIPNLMENGPYEETLDAIEEYLESLGFYIDEQDAALQTQIDSLDERMTAAEGRLDDHDNTLADHETRITQAEADIDSLETRMDTAESDIDDLEAAVDNLPNEYVQLGDDTAHAFVESKLEQDSENNDPWFDNYYVTTRAENTGGRTFSLCAVDAGITLVENDVDYKWHIAENASTEYSGGMKIVSDEDFVNYMGL